MGDEKVNLSFKLVMQPEKLSCLCRSKKKVVLPARSRRRGVANTTTCCLLLPTTEEDDEECDIVSNFVFFFLQNRKRDENVWLPSGLDLITHIALRWEELSNHLHTCLGNNGTMSVFPEMLPYSRRYPLMPRQFGIIHRIRVHCTQTLSCLPLSLLRVVLGTREKTPFPLSQCSKQVSTNPLCPVTRRDFRGMNQVLLHCMGGGGAEVTGSAEDNGSYCGVELLVPRVGEDPGILVVDERSAALRREKVFLER
ncbi:hypothetical protein Fcan01_21339 [Folsomia candida]|uniref:Uncharacterized protein n=1 Tax=Folsomia candida TaxID=158441 RepID=A0A226DH68_FOLCA|nr:hypothetical protein Fcan01_21339 [Folsomia candida]